MNAHEIDQKIRNEIGENVVKEFGQYGIDPRKAVNT